MFDTSFKNFVARFVLLRWIWSKTWRRENSFWYKHFFTSLLLFGKTGISGKPDVTDVPHYNVSGYGGFGGGGAGLPGGGSNPGYPVGTGVFLYKSTVN